MDTIGAFASNLVAKRRQAAGSEQCRGVDYNVHVTLRLRLGFIFNINQPGLIIDFSFQFGSHNDWRSLAEVEARPGKRWLLQNNKHGAGRVHGWPR